MHPKFSIPWKLQSKAINVIKAFEEFNTHFADLQHLCEMIEGELTMIYKQAETMAVKLALTPAKPQTVVRKQRQNKTLKNIMGKLSQENVFSKLNSYLTSFLLVVPHYGNGRGWLISRNADHQQGRSHWGGDQGGACPPYPPTPFTSISKPNKVQQFLFQTSEMLLFTGVQKLYGPEIPRFLTCMLQFLVNLHRLFIFFLTTQVKQITSREIF